MDDEWIDQEVTSLQREQQKKFKKRQDNSLFIRLMIFLLPLLLYSVCLQGSQPRKPHTYNAWYLSDGKKSGVNWVCQHCGARHWTADKARDWKGDIYCQRCGHKK